MQMHEVVCGLCMCVCVCLVVSSPNGPGEEAIS